VRRTVGLGFVALAVFTYCTRYIAAAIFGSNLQSHNAQLFEAMLQYVGTRLVTISQILGLVGIVYIIWAEVGELRK